MSNKLFSIGEVSKIFHVSVSSLRHYENIGLLKPEYIDSDTGYRYYSVRQFEALNSIRYLRELDMPLMEILDFLSNKDVELIENKLVVQRKIVIQKKEKLEIIEKKINNRLKMIEDAKQSKLEEIMIVEKEACDIIWLENKLTINDYLDMEEAIKNLKANQEEAVVFLGKVGLGISIENLNNNKYENYDGIFLIFDKEDLYSGNKTKLDKTQCVSIRFCGSHKDSPKYYKLLLDYIKKNNYVINNFSREITMIDYGITNDTNKFVTEICIPIIKG